MVRNAGRTSRTLCPRVSLIFSETQTRGAENNGKLSIFQESLPPSPRGTAKSSEDRLRGYASTGDVVEPGSDNSESARPEEGDGKEKEREKETRGAREKSRLVKPVGKARLAARPAGTSLSSPLCSDRTGAFANRIHRDLPLGLR